MHDWRLIAFALLGIAACGGNPATALQCDTCSIDSDCTRGGETCHLGICVPPGEDPRRCPNFVEASGSGTTTSSSASTGATASGSSSGASATGSTSSGSGSGSTSSGAATGGSGSSGSTASSSSGSGSSGSTVSSSSSSSSSASSGGGGSTGWSSSSSSSSSSSGSTGSSSSSSSSGSTTGGIAPHPLLFETAVVLPTLANPDSIAGGELNGSGHVDLVTGDRGAASVTVLRGNGDGTFAIADVPTVSALYGVALGDFNGDGLLDIAVTGVDAGASGSSLLAILQQTASGGFRDGGTYPAGDSVHNVAVGDLNEDGQLDLVVGDYGDDTLTLFSGIAGGAFTLAGSLSSPSGPRDPHIASIDGDGSPDIVVDRNSTNGINVLLNPLGTGAAGFSPVAYTQSADAGIYDAKAIAVGDLNEDGSNDVVTFNTNAGSLSIFLNDGRGDFTRVRTLYTEPRPYSGALADMNGDGHLDIVAADETDNAVEIYLGAGDGGFLAQPDGGLRYVFKTSSPGNDGSGPQALFVGDFNGDGKPDVATADNSGRSGAGGVSILLAK